MKSIKKWTKRIKWEEGFTLIEMSLVLFIISALLLLFVPNLSGRQAKAENTGDEAVANVIQAQVDMYKMDNNETTPATFQILFDNDYLTEKQLKKATDNFNLTEGKVTKKTNTSTP
ncbi:competence type IV pilus major pilin ComGC [Alkalibacterium kapii]|uniref:Competence protein ComGC n=1 Tax=Alkalibacterium kapii TaxID=426704 RepID=A0A511AT34_9LACT|nr:competence type IV pilus major pilin ComGC [Alkalibacterium kapii]GEK91358.1 hypothetical protein AKA01nite_09800 [Alkalibacterium kapii]